MVSTTPVPFRYSFETRSPRNLWSSVRQRCDGALADGQAFVLVLKNGHSVAEREVLSAQELRRALRYQREEDRINFMLGRTTIDRLLRPFGASLPCSIGKGRNGRPFIEGMPDFNLSHSGPYVACGVCRAGVIGVDVETFERFGDPKGLFAAVTHPAERNLLEATPVALARGVFRRCWTRKEAILKAAGSGLTGDLSSVDTRLAETSPVIEAPLPVKIIDVFADADEASLAIALSVWVTGMTVCFIDVDKLEPQAPAARFT